MPLNRSPKANITPPNSGPRNRYLADTVYPIGHGRCDQQDNDPGTGPTGPTATLTEADLTYSPIGPGHFGSLLSEPYPNGKRVIWSNGRQQIVKIDYDTFEILATFPLTDVTDAAALAAAEHELDAALAAEPGSQAGIDHAISLAMNYMVGLDGVYSCLDRDNVMYLGNRETVVCYADADPTDPSSPIIEKARWAKPAEITGDFVGCNMTFDGRLVLSTGHGWIVCLARDFSEYASIRLPGAVVDGVDVAAAYSDAMLAERGNGGYSWLRTSMCTEDLGDGRTAVYASSNDRTNKIIWTGQRLSLDEADGAWSAAYRNGGGTGSGTTPCLMGFDDEDKLLVIGDGDRVVNITLFWRDQIPDDWEQLDNAPSRRIAGIGPADMGDPKLEDIQTEQSITVSGYGAMTVNNEPAALPEGYPSQARRILVGYLGNDPTYTPHGLHKYVWNPTTRTFDQAWVCHDVASPNAVPYVSQGADLVYTVGARDGDWTVEAVDWTTGEPAFHYVLGGAQYNSLFAGIMMDEESRLMFGTTFGKVRIER